MPESARVGRSPNACTAQAPTSPARGSQPRGLPHTSELQSHSHLVCAWSSDVCRSEEHTSELQSHSHLVCRLLLEKKKIAYQMMKLSRNSQRSFVTVSSATRH